MQKTITPWLALMALTCTTLAPAHAQQERGRVLSVTPVTEQVAIPQEVCNNETVYTEGRATSGAGAVIGAIAGGAAGNSIGKGSGRAAATAVGIIGGALLGNSIESGQPGTQNVRRCTTHTYYENRMLGYDVLYEYGGRQYSTRTLHDPGRWIPLTVSVQPAVQTAPSSVTTVEYVDENPHYINPPPRRHYRY